MDAGVLFLGFLEAVLYCAIIVFIAFAVVWVLGWVGFQMSAEMLKWGKIIIGLICLIIMVGWLLSAFGLMPAYHSHWHLLR